MNVLKTRIPAITAGLSAAALLLVTGCNNASESPGASKAELDSLRAQITALTAGNATIAQYLDKFDTLDFTIFSGQQWVRFHESHADNIKVYWPDGHMTEGLPVHIEDLKKLFLHAPDTRVTAHPIKFGSGNMTAVTGVFEGTFTQPMPIGDGKTIPPTGKAFKMPMCTIGIWGADGTMTEEHLFWDNQTYMNQLALGQ